MSAWTNYVKDTTKLFEIFYPWWVIHYSRILLKKEIWFTLVKIKVSCQLTFTCLKSTIENSEQYMKSVQSKK